MEGMLHFGPYLRFESLDLLAQFLDLSLWQPLDLTPLDRHQPASTPGLAGGLFPLLDAGVSGIRKGHLFLSVQERLRTVISATLAPVQITLWTNPAVGIGSHVGFHPEVPLVALLDLMHLGVALAFPILGGGRARR